MKSYRMKISKRITLNFYQSSVYEKDSKTYAVIDEITLGMLKGSKIDYENIMIRSGFVVSKKNTFDG